MKKLPLYNKHGIVDYTIVDDDDFEILSQWRWGRTTGGYAGRTMYVETRSQARIAGRKWRKTYKLHMHRQIMKLEPYDSRQVDHIDRDRLNNQKSNLRLSSYQHNRMNTSSRGGSSSYRGVYWETRSERWIAQAFCSGKHNYLGSYDIEEDAAKAAQRFWDAIGPNLY